MDDMLTSCEPSLAVLPEPVLRRICSFLDRSNAISLAQTCRALQPMAEASIWAELNVSVQRSFLPCPLPHEWTTPLGGDRLYRIREAAIWCDDPLTDRIAKQGEKMDDYLVSLIHLLQSYPQWLRSVRAVYLNNTTLSATKTAELLEVLGTTLVRLVFVPNSLPVLSRSHGAVCSPLPVFDRVHSPFTSLRHLTLPLGVDWEPTIISSLPKAPHLRYLRLISIQPYSGSWDETISYPPAPSNMVWPLLPLLQKLEMDEMSLCFKPMLENLITSAPDLRSVVLCDPTRCWDPEPDDDLLATLGRSTKLEHLGVTGNCRAAITQPSAYKALKSLSLAPHESQWGVAHLDSLDVPPLAGVKRFFSYTQVTGEDRTTTWAWSGRSPGLPAPIRHIPPNVLKQLQAATLLEFIQFPVALEAEFHDQDYSYWGSPRCLEKRGRAVLIRTYRRDEKVFTHLRSYTAHHSHVEDGIIRRSENVWEEYTDLDGSLIPASILSAVYVILGETVAWTGPGRDLTLPDAAWEALQRPHVVEKDAD